MFTLSLFSRYTILYLNIPIYSTADENPSCGEQRLITVLQKPLLIRIVFSSHNPLHYKPGTDL